MNSSNLFAAFEKHPKSRRSTVFHVRRSRPEDLHALALISHEREGGALPKIRENMEKRIALPASRGTLFVAQLDQPGEQVVAYGGSAHLEFGEEAREPGLAPVVPTGWYLTGVVVRPQARRAGIG